MSLSRQLTDWRRHRSFSQSQLAEKSGLTRAYIVRLENSQADPSLSVLLKLAAALSLSVGRLLEEGPPKVAVSRDQLDRLARAVFHPGDKLNKNVPHARALARAFQDRRSALGLYHPRKMKAGPTARPPGQLTIKRLRSILGEPTWRALLQRIEKHAAFQAKPLS